MYFSLFCYYLPLDMDVDLHLNKLESPSPKNDLWKVWFKLVQWFWRRQIKFLQCMKNKWSFIWTNLNHLHQRMLSAKFGWNWPCGSGEEEHVNFLWQWKLQTEAHLSLWLRWAKKEPKSWINLITFRNCCSGESCGPWDYSLGISLKLPP